MLLTECGDVAVTLGAGEYFEFTPSLENMAKIGSPREIVEIWGQVNCSEAYRIISSLPNIESEVLQRIKREAFGAPTLRAAHLAMACCCEEDISPLIGHQFPIKMPAFMPIEDVITLGRHLMTHGLVGTQKPTGKGDSYAKEFKASEFIDAAMIHLGLSHDEAKRLTMTRFQNMMIAKFPQEDKAAGNQFPTDNEYEAAMKWSESVNAARLKDLN